MPSFGVLELRRVGLLRGGEPLRVIIGLWFFLLIVKAYATQQLIFAIDVIRHGDRAPTVALPKAAYPWPSGLGELTAEGMRQAYLLGEKFRREYIVRSHLLSEKYDSKQMYVRASDFNRTLMTANSVLFGLYPLGTGPHLKSGLALPAGYQPIPIHTLPVAKDNILVPQHHEKAYQAVLEKQVLKTAAWQKMTARYAPDFGRWQAATGLPIQSLMQVGALADNLWVRHIHNIPMPNGLSPQDLAKIRQVGNWGMAYVYQSEAMARQVAQRLLSEMAQQVRHAAAHQGALRYVLYAAHDSTLLAVMSALGAPLSKQPPYASDLQITLWQSHSAYRIKMKFNNQPIYLPRCKKTECTLPEFLDILQHGKSVLYSNRSSG